MLMMKKDHSANTMEQLVKRNGTIGEIHCIFFERGKDDPTCKFESRTALIDFNKMETGLCLTLLDQGGNFLHSRPNPAIIIATKH
ncbi:hypothetical protein T01_14251 [Trichinella spiralis]|uniref:Uncharacterized protein n=1 Tax=Trichinella spiralis TaxID=6334 RepID=A0A0V1BEP4_TRISP|nr:hypothetical protein T01_14251 [Trichinella spiralis]